MSLKTEEARLKRVARRQGLFLKSHVGVIRMRSTTGCTRS